MTEIQQMQNQLTEAFGRIQHLEKEIQSGQELPRWQYLVARPHRWRRQLSVKGRNMTVGQLVSAVRANRYTPEQASHDLELMEACEERRRVSERGYSLEPKDLPR